MNKTKKNKKKIIITKNIYNSVAFSSVIKDFFRILSFPFLKDIKQNSTNT